MSLQMAIWPKRCLHCNYEWTHTTIHSTSGSWVDSTQRQYETDKVTHVIFQERSYQRFCLNCVDPTQAKITDNEGMIYDNG